MRNLSHGQFNQAYLEGYLKLVEQGETNSNKGIVMLDEVDSGLDAQSQKNMAGILERMVRDTGHQIFASTHSPLVLNNLPESWRVFDLNQSPMGVYERGELDKSRIYEMMGH